MLGVNRADKRKNVELTSARREIQYIACMSAIARKIEGAEKGVLFPCLRVGGSVYICTTQQARLFKFQWHMLEYLDKSYLGKNHEDRL